MALPDDIVTEVFSYLPAKSVGRFRSLSRSWRATLSAASFVQLHLRRGNKSGHLKLFFPDDLKEEICYFYAWQPGGPVEKFMPNRFLLPTPLTKPLHGLVLIHCADAGYYVCNPSTGAALALPGSSILPSKMINRPHLPFYLNVAYGLGYCSASNQYKVVRVFSDLVGADDDDDGPETCCEVFVLDTLAHWRPSVQQPPPCIVEENPGVFLNGKLHFLCHDGGIIAFDVRDETFSGSSVVPPPGPEEALIRVTELDGCLCVCHGNTGFGDGAYRIWLLRDYERQQWEQLCYIDPTTAWTEPERMQLKAFWMAPLGMYKDGHKKKIMFGTGTCKVFAVDPNGGGAPEILFRPDEAIAGCFENYNDPVIGLLEESLVPVGRTIEEMILSAPTTKAWFDILKWMPARSVAELSLVCRGWRAMVKSDRFVQSHVVHANLNKSPRIMFVLDPTLGRFVDFSDAAESVAFFYNNLVVCCQPCHGLNAGSIAHKSFVCNPGTGYYEMQLNDGDDVTFFADRLGLGYNSETNKHLLVLVTYKEKNLLTREYQLECKMRYLKEQEWRPIEPPPRPVADTPPTYVDGKICWMVDPSLGPVSLDCEIVVFHVKTEEFRVIQVPWCSHGSGRKSILRIRGALCVACSDQSRNVIDIRMMMKDNVTWLMEYHIELEGFSPEYLSEQTTLLAVDPKDGRILLSTGQSLGYYDPKTVKMETIYSVPIEDDLNFCPVICDQSLVSTSGGY